MKLSAYKFYIFFLLMCCRANTQQIIPNNLALDGFSQWRTGHDTETVQILPADDNNALVVEDGAVVARAKFKVKGYGEMSFPLDPETPEGEEARKTDLSRYKAIAVTYKNNHEVVLQLRQTGVHGGDHNRIKLDASPAFVTDTIYFSEFRGGLKPLDLSDVAKFNFAFLSNNNNDGYAELVVRSFRMVR
jgi:hypothetical protein